MPKRVALVVDNPNRDLPGLVLLGRYLCSQDLTCYLVPMNLQNLELLALAPDFVVFNYLRSNNEDHVRRLHRANISYGCLDTEGGVVSKEIFQAVAPKSRDVLADASFYAAWGPASADMVQKAGLYSSDQVAITGNPRFDFYVDPWKKPALETSDYAEFFQGKSILFNGTFPLANPGFSTPTREVEMYVRQFGMDRELIESTQQQQAAVLGKFSSLAQEVATHIPEAKVVYRPHPFERLETYTDKFRAPNLRAALQGTVDGWILRADALVHFNCSTAIEAGMAGVPAFIPTWLTDLVQSSLLRPIPEIENVSVGCDSPRDLKAVLREALEQDFEIPARVGAAMERIVADWYFALDGSSHERVGSLILEHAESTKGADRAQCSRLIRSIGNARGIKGRTARFARTVLGAELYSTLRKRLPGGSIGAWELSGKHFSVQDVRKILTAIDPSQGVSAESAQVRGEYSEPLISGSSITLFPSHDRATLGRT
ncbi:MAG: hypothetical protein KY429_07600 [Actinobacteria bacterium]|nr:hypothetical protein [Actinomycetota bacterium]